MRKFSLLAVACFSFLFSSCLFRGSADSPEIHERQPAFFGKPLCVDHIVFYKDSDFKKQYQDDSKRRRIKREFKEALAEKLREAGFAVEECRAGADQLHLEIGGYPKLAFLFPYAAVVRVRAADNPVDFDNWLFEITGIEQPIAGTNEAQLRKTARALIDKIVAQIKEKADTAPKP